MSKIWIDKSVIDSVKFISENNIGSVVFIDLWTNQFRIPDIIAVNKEQEQCSHYFEGRVCARCGAKILFIGEEQEWIDYINNLWLISSLLKDKEIFIFTRKELPHWITTAFMPVIGNPMFKHHFSNFYLVTEDKYIINFYTTSIPSKNKIFISKDRLFNFINKCDVIINPTKKVLEISHLNGVPNIFVCNKQINKYTKDLRRSNGIFNN